MKDVNPKPNPPKGDKGGLISLAAIMFGVLMTLCSLVGVINTATGGKMQFKGVALPSQWDAALGLVGVTVIFWLIWAFLTYVPPVRRFGQRHPWWLALIVVLGLVGVIVGITLVDNANRAQRHAERQAKMEADSLKRLEESATFFEGKPIPYRLAVLNSEGEPLELWMDTLEMGIVPAYEMVEYQLPWKSTELIAKRNGKPFHRVTVNPDSTKDRLAARLQVYMPSTTLRLEVIDYSAAYTNGKLDPGTEFHAEMHEFLDYGNLISVKQSGPMYVYPNQPAPETSKYKVYRFVIVPDAIRNHDEVLDFCGWVLRHTDKRGAGQPAESPEAQAAAWKAEQ